MCICSVFFVISYIILFYIACRSSLPRAVFAIQCQRTYRTLTRNWDAFAWKWRASLSFWMNVTSSTWSGHLDILSTAYASAISRLSPSRSHLPTLSSWSLHAASMPSDWIRREPTLQAADFIDAFITSAKSTSWLDHGSRWCQGWCLEGSSLCSTENLSLMRMRLRLCRQRWMWIAAEAEREDPCLSTDSLNQAVQILRENYAAVEASWTQTVVSWSHSLYCFMIYVVSCKLSLVIYLLVNFWNCKHVFLIIVSYTYCFRILKFMISYRVPCAFWVSVGSRLLRWPQSWTRLPLSRSLTRRICNTPWPTTRSCLHSTPTLLHWRTWMRRQSRMISHRLHKCIERAKDISGSDCFDFV